MSRCNIGHTSVLKLNYFSLEARVAAIAATAKIVVVEIKPLNPSGYASHAYNGRRYFSANANVHSYFECGRTRGSARDKKFSLQEGKREELSHVNLNI